MIAVGGDDEKKVAAMSSETVPMLDVNGVNVNDVNELFVNKDTLKQNCLKTASAFVFLVLSFVLTGVSLVINPSSQSFK